MAAKRFLTTVLAPMLLVVALVSGCGGKSDTAATASPKASGGSSSAVATTTNEASSCPTDNTQAFPKVRFVTNLALAGGAFHRWVWKPYKAGTFVKGADGRTTALIKAGLATAFSAKQLNDAKNNVKADPALCKAFAQPLANLSAQFQTLKDKVSNGDLKSIEDVNKSVTDLENQSAAKGMPITEDENAPIGG